MLLAERSRGVGILLVSSDLDEVVSLSDRIAVLYEGEIVGVIDGDAVDVATIGELMAGTRVPSVGNRDLSAPRSAAL
jgi:simple sugar transport system ATP-binding protein